MGMGATNTLDRVAASIGALDTVPVTFASCMDVPAGGVLLALPALLAIGLLRHTKDLFRLKRGYYALESIFLLLALNRSVPDTNHRIAAVLRPGGMG